MKTISFDKIQEVQEKTRKQPKTVTVNGLDIEVTQYLPTSKKLTILIESMLSTSDEISFDRHLFDINLKTKIVENYTNIELPISILEGYNAIKETGVLDVVLKTISEDELSEIEMLKTLYIESEKEKRKNKNSLSYTVQSIVKTISENIPSGEQLEALMDALGDE